MGQHIFFLVLTPVLLAPAVHGLRGSTRGQDLELQLRAKIGSITEERCGTVVSEVQKSKSYTEESIRPICDREIKSSRCDFFAEALSLASSHSEFDRKGFCESIVSAQFCAQTMDKLLTSQAMADLARGDCIRAPNTRGSSYCEKFEKMLAYSVQNNDLDTMRACYMMEAYSELGTASNATNHTEGAANKTMLQPSHDAPQSRIISSSSKELDPVSGNERLPARATEGKNLSAADEGSSANKTAPPPSKTAEGESIVVEPKTESIVTEPVATNSEEGGSIATDPIYIADKNSEVPATQQEAEQLKPVGSEVNMPSADAKDEQPAATVPAATVPAATVSTAVTTSHQIPEVRLNIGGPANLLTTKTKALVVSKLLKHNALLNGTSPTIPTKGQEGRSNTSVKESFSNTTAPAASTNVTNS